MNYEALANHVASLIERYGKPLTLRSYSAQTIDPVTMTYTAGTPTDTEIHGVEESFKAYEVDGTLIKAGDRRFMVSSSVVPTTAMKLVISNVEYPIIRVDSIQPGTVTLYYTLQVRL